MSAAAHHIRDTALVKTLTWHSDTTIAPRSIYGRFQIWCLGSPDDRGTISGIKSGRGLCCLVRIIR